MATVIPNPALLTAVAVAPERLIGPEIRQRIMDRLSARLKRIQVVNGFSTDAGLDVGHGTLIIPEPATPSINYWDGDEQALRQYGQYSLTLAVTVEVYDLFELDDDTFSEDTLSQKANRMLGDVKRAVLTDLTGQVETVMQGLVEDINYASNTLILGTELERWVGSISEFQVVYVEEIGDPRKQPVKET